MITFRAMLAGAFFSAFFAYVAILGMNTSSPVYISSTQIAPLCYALLLVMVLLLNPFLKLIRFIRPFTIPEILIVFIMGAVSSGISIYGLTMQMVPIVGSMFYKDWNTEQAEWNRYVEPFVSENYFLAEPGIQDAAKEYREVLVRYEDLSKVQKLADDVVARKAEVKTAEALPEPAHATAVARAQRYADDAEKLWKNYAASKNPPPPAPEEIVKTYPSQIVEQKKLVEAHRESLKQLTDKAAAKVELFRRGLPKTMQAYPGIIPVPGDDSQSYWGRLHRLTTGSSALSGLTELNTKLAALKDEDLVASSEDSALQNAITKLEPLSDAKDVAAAQSNLIAEVEHLRAEIERLDQELAKRTAAKRSASMEQMAQLTAEIKDLNKQKASAQAERDRLTLQRTNKDQQLEIANRIKTCVADLRQFSTQITAGKLTAAAARTQLSAIVAQFPSFDVSTKRYLFGDTPWAQWWPVLWRWGLLAILTYVILMTFNVLIFRQWAHNEKLIYPLAELPMIIGGNSDEKPGGVPDLFKSGLFWLGFFVSASILGWNFLSKAGLIEGIAPLNLDGGWAEYIKDTFLKALIPRAQSQIFFTVIGLSFFTPAKTSFSLWFFYLFFLLQVLILCGLGYGENMDSFPSNWWYTLNFATAQGEGAMIVFASVALYTCRKYLLCAFAPSVVKELEFDEQRELRWSSGLFVGCTLGLILMLWQGMGANLGFTLVILGGILLLTIGLVRAVAEGGIMGFQAFAGPFHFIRTFLGFDQSYSSPAMFTPLMVYYSVFFLDIKSFIAPMIANSLKMRDELRLERGRYHVALVVAVSLAAIVSIGTSLMMAYAHGANGLEGWFYSGMPPDLYSQLKSVNQNPPAASFSLGMWMIAGATAMAALLFFRQSLFWLPHPIGMIMLINPLMRFYWFPIFLGWLAKALVTRYGSRDTYTRVRAFFIGLIVGELIVVTLVLVLGYWFNLPNSRIDLDRAA